MAENKMRAHVVISGHVQGVFFRAETREAARRTGVSGWVRNTRDGRVEAVFEGNTENVEKMIQWCRHGPSTARVENMDVERKEWTAAFNSFSIRY